MKNYKISEVSIEDFGEIEGASEGAHLCIFFYDALKSQKETTIDIQLIKEANYSEEDLKRWEMGKIKAEAQNFSSWINFFFSNFF